jgi:hypothetical protein
MLRISANRFLRRQIIHSPAGHLLLSELRAEAWQKVATCGKARTCIAHNNLPMLTVIQHVVEAQVDLLNMILSNEEFKVPRRTHQRHLTVYKCIPGAHKPDMMIRPRMRKKEWGFGHRRHRCINFCIGHQTFGEIVSGDWKHILQFRWRESDLSYLNTVPISTHLTRSPASKEPRFRDEVVR